MTALAWTDGAAALPDDDILVLIALTNGEVWPGYRDGDAWRYVDAMPITGERVTHWMHMPIAPSAYGRGPKISSIDSGGKS
jgi:hypothetical protein